MTVETPPAEVSRHKCLIYDGDPSEQLPVVVPLLVDGLRDGCRCLYLGSPDMVRMAREALGAKGIDVDREVARGAMVLSTDRSHLDNGFDPRAMVDMLGAMVDAAVQDGFAGGLCATGDMRWELGEDANFERLLEYEALLEDVFRTKRLRGICQYHRAMVPPKALQDALLAHRSLYLGDALAPDNLFYVPPQLLLEAGARDRVGDWMCRQITRVMAAERKRDEALAALIAREAELRRLSAALAEANKGLEDRVRERTAALEALNRELESFSYSVSHDLRAPLRGIDGFSQALMEDEAALSAEGRENLARVRAASQRMGRLIDDMLALSRVSRKPLARERVDLTALARAVLKDLRTADPARAVEARVADGLAAAGDPGLLRAILDNLIGNAWKFTARRPDGVIEVGEGDAPGGGRAFYVRDNGAGFDMAYAGKLFGMFQRLHGAGEFEGTGIGLATVQRIVQRHGGRIWAEGAVGRGATFYFTLAAPEA